MQTKTLLHYSKFSENEWIKQKTFIDWSVKMTYCILNYIENCFFIKNYYLGRTPSVTQHVRVICPTLKLHWSIYFIVTMDQITTVCVMWKGSIVVTNLHRITTQFWHLNGAFQSISDPSPLSSTLFPAVAGSMLAAKKLWQTHCTLPAQHQKADGQSCRLTGEHKGAFSSKKLKEKKNILRRWWRPKTELKGEWTYWTFTRWPKDLSVLL